MTHPLKQSRLCASCIPYVLAELSSDAGIRAWHIMVRSGDIQVATILIEPIHQKEPLPVVIYNRGGNQLFNSLTSERVTKRLTPIAQAGYVVIASQYRGGEGSEGSDEFGGKDVDDVLALYELLKSHPGADLKRIGMFGESRGGMMTYLALQRVDWIRAAISIGGFSNLARAAELRPEMLDVFKECFGGATDAMMERSAVHHAQRFSKSAPLLLMHGASDWRVSPLDTLDLSAALIKERVPHRTIVFEGADHMLSEHRTEVQQNILIWLQRYVKELQPWPNPEPHGR